MKQHKYLAGIIGNCSYIAHIDTMANVAWMCWPYFDSSFVFGRLLDDEKGGTFSITPTHIIEAKQYYLTNTNILCTEFNCKDGKFRVIDFAPRFFQNDRSFMPLMLFRKIEIIEGEPEVTVICDPVYEYSDRTAKTQSGSHHILYTDLGMDMRLTSDVPLTYVLTKRKFLLTKTSYLCFSQNYSLEASLEHTAEDFLKKTAAYWRSWVRYSTICNFHQKEVIRSCLILKLHQFEDTGAIIAASTTSLPEAPGSGRNWDYRYCWIRDAHYTLNALELIGHGAELERYAHFIQNVALRADGRYSPVYSIRGEIDFPEKIVPLKGYLGNQPVRVGNQALEHIQNDVYGQIIVSLLPLFVDEKFAFEKLASATKLTHNILKQIENTMEESDAGLWEQRTSSQQYCYTYLFHWAGCNAAKKIASLIDDSAMFEKADQLLKKSIEKIESFYDEKEKAYTQSRKPGQYDASLFQLITMNYLDPDSDRAKNHLATLEKNLKFHDSLVYRYVHEDDFGKPETTFFVCSFWYVEALACVGRVEEAIQKFSNLVEYGNHLGLFSEDVDDKTGSQWGNFPQTYSHVGLVNAAFRIERKLDRPNFIFYEKKGTYNNGKSVHYCK